MTVGGPSAGDSASGPESWGPEADILVDLAAEEGRLSAALATLDEAQWATPSGAPGWSVADVVLHLAQSEELVVATVSASGPPSGAGPHRERAAAFSAAGAEAPSEGIDAVMERLVRAERDEPAVIWRRWESARRAALEALASADPGRSVAWAAAPLRPRTLATTRLAEHWAHGLDVAGLLGFDFDDTARLRHIAWLGHRSLPYAFAVAGEGTPDVYCELDGPTGEAWCFGSPDAATVVRGSAGDFCRVGARRLDAASSGLEAEGPQGALALALLRNYAA